MIKLLKILAVIFYCGIPIASTHIALPLIFFLVLGFFSGSFSAFLLSLLFTGVLVLFVYSAFRPKRKRDLYLFIVGGIILLIPIIYQCHWLWAFEHTHFYKEPLFFGSVILFLMLIGGIVYTILRED